MLRRMKRMCYISKCECGQFILLLSCFLCCVPFSQKRWRDGDHCGHIFQHLLYLKELHFRRYRVWTPTLHQRTPAWGTKNKHPTPKYTQVRSCTHTRHPLSPSVHCNYKLSSGGESHSSDTESKPLAKKKNEPRDFQLLFPSREGAWRWEWRWQDAGPPHCPIPRAPLPPHRCEWRPFELCSAQWPSC